MNFLSSLIKLGPIAIIDLFNKWVSHEGFLVLITSIFIVIVYIKIRKFININQFANTLFEKKKFLSLYEIAKRFSDIGIHSAGFEFHENINKLVHFIWLDKIDFYENEKSLLNNVKMQRDLLAGKFAQHYFIHKCTSDEPTVDPEEYGIVFNSSEVVSSKASIIRISSTDWKLVSKIKWDEYPKQFKEQVLSNICIKKWDFIKLMIFQKIRIPIP